MAISEDTKYVFEAGKPYLIKNDLYGFYRYIFTTDDATVRDKIRSDEIYEAFKNAGIDVMDEFKKNGLIPESAFIEAKNIGDFEIPEGIRAIEMFAFEGCDNLNLKRLPESLKFIGEYAFSSCKNLSFDNGTLVIPASVDTILERAFAVCPKITKVIFEGMTNTLEDRVFQNCDNITEIHVPWQPDEDVVNWGAVNAEIFYAGK